MRNELVAEKIANRGPEQADMEYATLDVRTADDVHRGLWLLRFAYLIEDAKRDACASVTARQPDNAS
jgi:hypothetical protein